MIDVEPENLYSLARIHLTYEECMPKMFVISLSELRANLPDIVHKVLAHKHMYIITKHGRAHAKLEPIPAEELEKMQ